MVINIDLTLTVPEYWGLQAGLPMSSDWISLMGWTKMCYNSEYHKSGRVWEYLASAGQCRMRLLSSGQCRWRHLLSRQILPNLDNIEWGSRHQDSVNEGTSHLSAIWTALNVVPPYPNSVNGGSSICNVNRGSRQPNVQWVTHYLDSVDGGTHQPGSVDRGSCQLMVSIESPTTQK